MNLELLARLSECYEICRRLEMLLHEDEAAFGSCINGDVFDAYMQLLYDAKDEVNDIKKQIYILHDEISSAM